MLLQYNLNNSKTEQTKVNVIYSKYNNSLPKMTTINGKKFKMNYPCNIVNNLSSKVLMVQKIKFDEKNDLKVPKRINNAARSLELNVRKVKVRILSGPKDKYSDLKSSQEKKLLSPLTAKKINFDLESSNTTKKRTESKGNLDQKLLEIKNDKIKDSQKSNK